MAQRAQHSRKRTRIQERNEKRILDAALDIFSSYGFRGSTIDQIAGAPQPVRCRIEADFFQQPLQLVIAALDVANDVSRHGADSPRTKTACYEILPRLS